MSEIATTATLGTWIADAAAILEGAGSASPRAETERLAAHALGIRWGDLWSRMGDVADVAALEGALARRLAGEPLAYIEGSVVFYGLEVACGPGVLVPRPETETLVDVALEVVDGVASPLVVDVGCGTGAVAIAIASRRPDAEVWAIDISSDALSWAERNVAAVGVAVRCAHGDLFDALPPRMRGGVDLVVSNPPYVPLGADLPPDVGAEPPVALFAGPRGDEVLLRLVRETPAWLGPHGSLVLEVGTPGQAATIAANAFGDVQVRDDHTGRARALWMRRKGAPSESMRRKGAPFESMRRKGDG